MEKNLIYRSIKIFILMLFAVSALEVHAQDKIRVVGKVVTKDQKPVSGVFIIDTRTQDMISETDDNGEFRINIDPKAKIKLQSMFIDPKIVDIKGQTSLTIVVKTNEFNQLSSVTVSAKTNFRDSIRIEPGDVIQMGDKFYINAAIRLGLKMFSTDQRLVAQAILYNYNTKQCFLMPPKVIDGNAFGRTQRRMYDRLPGKSNLVQSKDVLGDYESYLDKKAIAGKGKQKSYRILYKDSVSVVVGKKDFIRCDIAYTLEDYTKINKRVIQNYVEGVINPLRFMEIPFKGTIITDPKYFPAQELQKCDSKGQINLTFAVGKTNLDMNVTQNRVEMSKLEKQLETIANTRGAALKNFKIMGTASPDGRYETNKRLAEGRMASARSLILNMLSSETRSKMYSSAHSQVAPWDSVVSMLRVDTLNTEADIIEEIIKNNPGNHNAQSAQISKLPLYGMLKEKYLPKLRKVEYEITYEIRRVLTLDEINALYKEDPRSLTKYEYFRLIRGENDSTVKKSICQNALKSYSKFMMAANDLQKILIDENEPDDNLLTQYIKPKSPQSLLANHVISLLHANRYSAADTVATLMTKNAETEMLLAVVGVYNNRIKDNYEMIEKTSPRNKVLIRLYMNKNEEAMSACKELDENDPFTHYLLATCHKRLRNKIDANRELRQAMEMDPKLEEDAKIDGDLRDIYKQIKNIK